MKACLHNSKAFLLAFEPEGGCIVASLCSNKALSATIYWSSTKFNFVVEFEQVVMNELSEK
jgi:hypothetical protein